MQNFFFFSICFRDLEYKCLNPCLSGTIGALYAMIYFFLLIPFHWKILDTLDKKLIILSKSVSCRKVYDKRIT